MHTRHPKNHKSKLITACRSTLTSLLASQIISKSLLHRQRVAPKHHIQLFLPRLYTIQFTRLYTFAVVVKSVLPHVLAQRKETFQLLWEPRKVMSLGCYCTRYCFSNMALHEAMFTAIPSAILRPFLPQFVTKQGVKGTVALRNMQKAHANSSLHC